jgi:FkbM family methyltransferase
MVIGSYEPLTSYLFRKSLKRGDVIVDVGAAFGQYTLIAGKTVGDKGKVYAFEPNLHLFNVLLKNIYINRLNNIVAVPKAVSNNHSVAKLYLSEGLESSLIDLRGLLDQTKGTTHVETVSLDKFLNGIPVSFVKVDVEGGEMDVLLGMRRILENNKNLKMFIEFTPIFLLRAGHEPMKLLNTLFRHNFKLYAIYEEEKALKHIYENNAGIFVESLLKGNRKQVNLLCVKKQ